MKKSFSRRLTIALALTLALGLWGCQKQSPETAPETTKSQAETEAPSDQTEAPSNQTEAPADQTEAPSNQTEAPSVPVETPQGPFTNGEYATYTINNSGGEPVCVIPDVPAKSGKCSAMQGMTTTERYVYATKITSANTYAIITQYDTETGSSRLLEYYPSADAAEPEPLDVVVHCNEMTSYQEADGSWYLVTSSGGVSKKFNGLTRFRLDEENGKLYLTGFFHLTRINSSGEKVSCTPSAARRVGYVDGYHYFLIKNASDFYWCKIPEATDGGTMENPTEIEAFHLFTIDTRNAIFVDENGSTYTIPNLENWTNQGFYYSESEDLLYVPLFNQYLSRHDNVILLYSMAGRLETDALDAVTENREERIFPATTAFRIQHETDSQFEVESCGFLAGPGGGETFYFNTNSNFTTLREGIWTLNYSSGNTAANCILKGDEIICTVSYDYNVDGVKPADWKQDTPSGNFSMKKDTTHVSGIPTNLRINCFIRSGYTFTGWNLCRESDGKWLYADGSWYTEAEAPAGSEKMLVENSQPVDGLTEVQGDHITAYAQWESRK